MKNIIKTNPCTPYAKALWKLPVRTAKIDDYDNVVLGVTIISRGLYISRVWEVVCRLFYVSHEYKEDLEYNVTKWSLSLKICKQLRNGQPCVMRSVWSCFSVTGLNQYIWDVRFSMTDGLRLIKGIDPWYKEPCRGCGNDTDGGHFCNSCKQEAKINVTNCGNKNCQGGVINGINPKVCKKCNP